MTASVVFIHFSLRSLLRLHLPHKCTAEQHGPRFMPASCRKGFAFIFALATSRHPLPSAALQLGKVRRAIGTVQTLALKITVILRGLGVDLSFPLSLL